MATIIELSEAKEITKIDPGLEPGTQEFRVIYASPRLITWMSDILPALKSEWDTSITPLEQLDAFLEIYGSGEVLTYDRRFKPLCHHMDGIWEFKTPDLRLFGWFVKKDQFVGWAADLAAKVKKHELYHGYAREAGNFRQKLKLDEPKYITGEDPYAVVSNFDYP